MFFITCSSFAMDSRNLIEILKDHPKGAQTMQSSTCDYNLAFIDRFPTGLHLNCNFGKVSASLMP